MRSLTHFLRSSNLLSLNSSVSDRDSLPSICLVSPQRRTRKLKKKNFSVEQDFSLLWWHSVTLKRIEKAKPKIPNRRQRLFLDSILKTKHQSLTSFTFMRLVPPADQVVRHICFRCIKCKTLHTYGFLMQYVRSPRELIKFSVIIRVSYGKILELRVFHCLFVRRNYRNFLKFMIH